MVRKISDKQRRLDEAREAEHSAYYRYATRYIPACICGYIAFFLYEGDIRMRSLILIFSLYIIVEVLYAALKKDHWSMTLCTWLIWSWFGYAWYMSQIDFLWVTAGPLPVVLLVLSRLFGQAIPIKSTIGIDDLKDSKPFDSMFKF